MVTLLAKDLNREFRMGTEMFVLTLRNDFSIDFRRKGTKTRYNVSLGACYNMSLINTALIAYQTKLDRYNARRKLGYIAKKPKKPSIQHCLNPIYSIALKNS